MSRAARRVRYAVVGQGYIAQIAVLPAFRHARANSELVALVSDDPRKRKVLGRRYRVHHLTDYEGYDALLGSGDVDAVYIALPNSMHREFTERAAAKRVHVLCEKPMAVTSKDCAAMIRACARTRVKLMIAYRLHFERANLEALEIVRSGRIGEPRVFSSLFTMQVKRGNVRLDADLGGGTLYDIGIYCLNAARMLFDAEPAEAFAFSARSSDARFREVDEMTSGVLRFPKDRLAMFTSSFGAADTAAYQIVGTKGNVRVDPAYEFAGRLRLVSTVGERTFRREFPRRDQFAPELIHFSDCVLTGRDPEPSGAEGLADVRAIEALYRSAATGRPVRVPPTGGVRRPDPRQEIRRPPVTKPDLIRAEGPTR
jgi:predicted dehydrogenase